MSIAENLARLTERIEQACRSSGREPEEVTLICVTKTVGTEAIRELYELGVRDIGENRVQDALRKAEAVGELPDLRWHMIGHLQRNKVRAALRLFETIHSVDSVRLIEHLERECAKRARTLPILLEVNLSGEETKYGVPPGEIPALLDAAASKEHLELQGLMTMAPLVDDPEETRPLFASLRGLQEKFEAQGYPLRELSMGMTQDFEVAIEEGATIIRVGTALFKEP